MTSSGHAHFDRQRCGVSSIGVRRRRKFGEVSCTECIGKGMTLSDSDGKMETRHPVEGSFGNEFLSIYNHCGVTGGLKSQYVEKKFNFCVFFRTTPYREISKILFRKDSSPHRSTCYGQISWNLADRKSVKPCVAYLTKKKQNFAWLSSSRYCADRAQNLPECAQSPRDFIQIGSFSAELY